MTEKFMNRIVTIDGMNNYIEIVATTRDHKRELFPLKVHKDAQEIFKFNNIEVAKLTARRLLDPAKSYEYLFVIGNTEININDTQKIGQYYQYYDTERGIKYFIKDNKTYRLTKAGYICFEHGEERFCEKEYGFKRQLELLAWINEAIDRNMQSKSVISILSREKISNKEYVYRIKDSTARIHILTNSKLMDWNQDRKAKEIMCLPYKRNMDKFTTFPVFVAKDVQERMYFDSDKRCIQIINDIITDLRNDLPGTELDKINPVWVETEYKGYIKINENKIH